MATIKLLSEEIFNYKGVEVKRVDTIEEALTWNRGAFAERVWTVNGKKAHTYKLNGVVYLAYYEVEASKGGTRIILRDFNPSCGFHISYDDSVMSEINKLGLFVEFNVEDTEF